MMKSLPFTTMGIDLGKNSVHVVAMDSSGTVVLRKRLSHARLVMLLANSPLEQPPFEPDIAA